MPRPLRLAAVLAAFLAVAALAACAPPREWVNPAAPAAVRDADLGNCNAAAWTYARQRAFLIGPRPFAPNEAPWGGVRTSQASTLEALDRNRFFEGCMETRGYTLQPVAPP